MMLIKCDICGCEFDHTNAGRCDCGFGRCGEFIKCPNCGIHIDLPEEIRDEVAGEYEKNTIYSRLERELGMK